MSDQKPASSIDTSRPHSARMYDYYLGGKDWYPIDAQAARRVEEVFPSIQICAHKNRGFMHRAVRQAARDGIRQFIDIGSGIPTEPNLHQVAQAVAPESRVVYADNDPVVEEYTRILTPGRATFIQADLRDPDLLKTDRLRAAIDLSQPIALSLVAVLHFIPDDWGPYDIVRNLLDHLAPGSYLILSHATGDFDTHGAWPKVAEIYNESGTPAQFRSYAAVRQFFTGLHLLEPSVTTTPRWRPDEAEPSHLPEDELDESAAMYGGVAVKQ